MIHGVLAVLFILWLLGIVQIPYLAHSLFTINGQNIRVLEALMFLAIVWIIGLLKTPFREIVMVLFFIWILSMLGIITISGLSDLAIIAVVIGVAASLIRR